MKKSVLKKAEPYLWLLPAFILFGVFTFYPFLVYKVEGNWNTRICGA